MCRLSRDLYDRTCAFVRTMANTCDRCLRPRSCCDECDLVNSRFLLQALSEAELPAQDRLARTAPPSLKERCDFYLGVVAKAGRWLTAKEIDPSNRFCGRGLKYWTLRRMAKHGQLKTYCDGKTVYFNLPNKEHAK